MGSPWACMENPRMSEIMDFNETHYSVRQNGGTIRNVFPLHPVTSKRPESPYGAKYFVLAENPVFQFFGLYDPYRTPIDRIGIRGSPPHPRMTEADRLELGLS